MPVRNGSALLVIPMVCLWLRPMPVAAAPQCVPSMAAGEVCGCALAALHPTQLAVGTLHVEELKGEGLDHLADHVKRKKHAKIVFGPDGATYIVDGHHHATAMMSLDPGGETTCVIAVVVKDLPSDPASFWTAMEGHGLARLEGVDGVKHPGAFPPAKLTELQNDPFRSLSSWIEDRCGMKLAGDFADFKLADLLRRDPKAIAPRTASDEDPGAAEGLAYLHGPAAADLARIVGPADAKSIASCK